MQLRKLFITGFLICELFLVGRTQSVLVSGGGDLISPEGSASYSIGQLFYASTITNKGTITETIQFPYEIESIITGNEFSNIKLEVSAYPNPVSKTLFLKIKQPIISNLNYQLYDQSGKLLESKKIKEQLMSLSLEAYGSETFLLQISQNKQTVKTFKIVKN